MNRRNALQTLAATSGLALPGTSPLAGEVKKDKGNLKFCLNTSTISGQKAGIEKYIDIAARAGFEYLEPWIPDMKAYVSNGGSLRALRKLLDDSKVKPVNAIGFAAWMSDDDEQRKAGFKQMREEMEMVAELGCPRIAAPAAGVRTPNPDLYKVGERYKELLDLGRQTGVMPQLEIWGASVFFHIGQAMMAVAVANDSDARILPDVYHLFRGNSGFESLKMLDGNMIEVFHMNDYPGNMPREQMEDKDRIYPGDGIAPLKQIFADLKQMEGDKYLSLELFNREYWKLDPLQVAKTGLEKMKKAVAA
ncbi:MAG TPA: sugar phosphate isomerase/epimerase family protein [Chryseosolibacter sp.]|nr:sugar phosphate isomerase/epimerase family protein [Chryseosolibacter sp.]